MSANFLSFVLWICSMITNAIGWYIVASRQKDAEILKRLSKLEKNRDKMIGWVFGRFGEDLNGD